MKKTILILVSTLGGGGAERRALMTAKGLLDDYKVKVVIFDSSYISYQSPCEVIDLNIPIKNSMIIKIFDQFTRAIKLKKLRLQEKTIAVISFGPAANRANCFSYGVGETIVSLTEFKQAQKSVINRFIFGVAKKIICQTIAMNNKLLEGYPNIAQKTIIINNGLDLEYIRQQSKIKQEKQSFNSSDFVAVGRLNFLKGYHHLLQALSIVLEKLPSATLTIIGDGELREELEDHAKRLGISRNVTFCGFLDNPFVVESLCSVYVLPSISEGFPNALIEAMACGVPVIATDCKSGPREILSEIYQEEPTKDIEYGDYGILVPPFITDDSDEPEKDQMLAEAMYLMASDKLLRTKYAALAQQRANDFSLEKYIGYVKTLLA